MESAWLKFAKRLHALSSTGLAYDCDEFDRERYQEIRAIAAEMMALLGHVKIDRVEGLVSEDSTGYTTPKIDVRGAVFQKERLLLVREKSNGLWTLPGGFADVGLSAAENIEKEVEEEAGLKVTARSIYCIRHKAKGNYQPDIRDFYKLFFLCETDDNAEPAPGPETSEARYFHRHKLPDLCNGRILSEDLSRAWEYNDNRSLPTFFD